MAHFPAKSMIPISIWPKDVGGGVSSPSDRGVIISAASIEKTVGAGGSLYGIYCFAGHSGMSDAHDYCKPIPSIPVSGSYWRLASGSVGGTST